jgi:hypothetical protein
MLMSFLQERYFPVSSTILRSVSRIEKCESQPGERPHIFRLVHRSATEPSLYCAADSSMQMDDWIQAISLRLLLTERPQDQMLKESIRCLKLVVS